MDGFIALLQYVLSDFWRFLGAWLLLGTAILWRPISVNIHKGGEKHD